MIFNPRNQLLLQRRTDNGEWALPGGSMEPGETLLETAHRETFEEMGIKLSRLHFFEIYSGPDFFYVYPNGDQSYHVVAAYIGHIDSDHLKVDPLEVSAAGYFDTNSLPNPISATDKIIIDDYLKKFSRDLLP